MCGTGNKTCGICANADGNCLASMREDFFIPATIEQVKNRIKENKYPDDIDVMRKYIGESERERIYEMTPMQLTLEAAIREAGEHKYVYLSKEDAEYILEILKKYEKQNEPVRLKEPNCCRECKSIEQLNGSTYYCHMIAILPPDEQQDIASKYLNPDERPEWCPISKTNRQIEAMEPKEQEKVCTLIKGLSVMFGDRNFLSGVKFTDEEDNQNGSH